MGNCGGRIAGEKPIRLLGSAGELRLLAAPVTAAEIMLESPGYAVAPVDGVRLKRRVVAVVADEDLRSGMGYLLVPVGRVGSRVSDLQLAVIERAVFGGGKSGAAAKRRRFSLRGSKVLPEVVGDGVGCEMVEGFDVEKSGGGCRRWRYRRRNWSPVLEPIMESR